MKKTWGRRTATRQQQLNFYDPSRGNFNFLPSNLFFSAAESPGGLQELTEGRRPDRQTPRGELLYWSTTAAQEENNPRVTKHTYIYFVYLVGAGSGGPGLWAQSGP